MTSTETRNVFLEFFRGKEHRIVPSAPMVVKNDPTLMFVNAGMNQFKDYFLGNAFPENPRIADTQKCLRVSGKHNDLEEVGVDTYHHTMFEMLGNWSFGDYFKKEAIDWAWELLTVVYNIDKNRLYVTVFGGDQSEGLEKDSEAIALWKKWIPEERILLFSKKDNFWEMGDVGPCGPCSEIHVDIRDDSDRKKIDGKTLVNTGNPLVVEIWNLVFIQFERKADGSLKQLPSKHVDTGMGFERLCMVLQKKKSNYDTDVFRPLIEKIADLAKISYGTGEKTDIATRVIADHIRAISFSIADGQLPSNTGAGYVIRRILRRAVRYGYSFLKQEEPFIYKLVQVLAEQMGEVFPEIRSQRSLVEKVIKEEEDSFLRTLDRGIAKFNQFISENNKQNIEGSFAFELYDTFGFPIDLTELLARENNLTVDLPGFEAEMKKQKDRSRAASAIDTGDWIDLFSSDQGLKTQNFTGYDTLEDNIKIIRYRKIKSKGKEQFQLAFDKTPFYPEGGGQVGDTGYIEPVKINGSGEKIFITDTKKENNLIIHFSDKLPANPASEFKAVVNSERRSHILRNHSATHLLHEALRKILGTHVQQKGSLVHPDYLRFDFSHFQKMSAEEIEKVERIVNEKIRLNLPLDEKRDVPIEEAGKMGAMALFGEKYGDKVRVIRFGNSVELCGGTHVQATGQIGYFKIISESAVAAGIRRIEAITGEQAQHFITEQLKKMEHIKALLNNPKDIETSIQGLLDSNSSLAKQIQVLNHEKAKGLKEVLMNKKVLIKDINLISAKVDLDPSAIKNLAFQLKSHVDNLFLVLANEADGKAGLTVALSDSLVKEKNMDAGKIIRELAKEIKGGGGGQAFYATAGGSDISGIERALKKAESIIPA